MTTPDTAFRIAEMLLAGLKCSHILMKLTLEAQGRDDPGLVRAMSGLALGMGQGFDCGALTAGCCVLGLHAGRAGEDEADDPRFTPLLDEFTGWFHANAHEHFGGIACANIMRFDPALKQERCPALIGEVWERLNYILVDHGIDPTESLDPARTAP